MIKNPSRKDGTTATQAYQQRRNDIFRLLDVVEMELEKHAEKQAADCRNWGLAGDLGKIRSDLIDIVVSLSGTDRELVNEFLTEAQENA